jgi:hypothetical protein
MTGWNMQICESYLLDSILSYESITHMNFSLNIPFPYTEESKYTS